MVDEKKLKAKIIEQKLLEKKVEKKSKELAKTLLEKISSVYEESKKYMDTEEYKEASISKSKIKIMILRRHEKINMHGSIVISLLKNFIEHSVNSIFEVEDQVNAIYSNINEMYKEYRNSRYLKPEDKEIIKLSEDLHNLLGSMELWK